MTPRGHGVAPVLPPTLVGGVALLLAVLLVGCGPSADDGGTVVTAAPTDGTPASQEPPAPGPTPAVTATAPPASPTATATATAADATATPTASPADPPPSAPPGEGIAVIAEPPRYDGGEAEPGPPVHVADLTPAEIRRGDGGWIEEDPPAIERYTTHAGWVMPPPAQAGWQSVCLSYDGGGPGFCAVVWTEPSTASVFLAADGLTSMTCADGTQVTVADLPQDPAPVCDS